MQDDNLLYLFFNLINSYLYSILVKYKDITVSISAAAWIVLL